MNTTSRRSREEISQSLIGCVPQERLHQSSEKRFLHSHSGGAEKPGFENIMSRARALLVITVIKILVKVLSRVFVLV